MHLSATCETPPSHEYFEQLPSPTRLLFGLGRVLVAVPAPPHKEAVDKDLQRVGLAVKDRGLVVIELAVGHHAVQVRPQRLLGRVAARVEAALGT